MGLAWGVDLMSELMNVEQKAKPIALVPIGQVGESILAVIGQGLQQAFGRVYVIAAPLSHPDYAHDRHRGQYLAVIALPRLRQGFYGLPGDEALFHQRAVKEATHELGHTYGLGRCRNPRCVMCFSNSLRDVDRKERDFCPSCRRKLP